MFDTMKVTKIVASLCGVLLLFLFANWGANTLFGLGEEGHGEHHAENSYVIEVAAADDHGGDTMAAEEGPTFAERFAAADAEKGKKVFGKCKACHKTEAGANAVGPSLHNVVGRATGTAPGFSYSSAMAGHGGNWTPENMDHFLTKPKDFVPGTKMGFAGLKKPQDRVNVIAYLQSISD